MSKDEKITTGIALFQGVPVRKALYNGEWYLSVIDVITILTGSENPRRYWSDLKRKLRAEGYNQLYENIVQLKMESADHKFYATDAANATTLLRIIQSIPSPKAEPFKRWLAEVGNERLQEIENPELAMTRMKELYEQKGYPQEWVEARMRGIAIRNELTEEWESRGAQEGREYAILTNEIAQATFGMGIQQHKNYKGLQRENLRDHMTDLELILTMLGEATSTALHRERDTQGFPRLQRDARDAGQVAGRTREDIEAQTGKPVASSDNYLHLTSGDAPGKKLTSDKKRKKKALQPPLIDGTEDEG